MPVGIRDFSRLLQNAKEEKSGISFGQREDPPAAGETKVHALCDCLPSVRAWVVPELVIRSKRSKRTRQKEEIRYQLRFDFFLPTRPRQDEHTECQLAPAHGLYKREGET